MAMAWVLPALLLGISHLRGSGHPNADLDPALRQSPTVTDPPPAQPAGGQ